MKNTQKILKKETRITYVNRAKGLVKKFETMTDLEVKYEIESFLHWLHVQACDLSPATRRMYRNAVSYYFKIRYRQDPLILLPEFMRCTNVTRENVRKKTAKEHRQKSLNYCFRIHTAR